MILPRSVFRLTDTAKQFAAIQRQRNLWKWINKIFNQVDESRIKEIGPDHACAEWLIKNGAAVRWCGEQETFSDYDKIKLSPQCIEEIDASGSSIMHYGFSNLRGCRNIKKVKLHNCMHLYDEALEQLELITESLQHLQISRCWNITDNGLLSLEKLSLRNLKTLILFELVAVKNKSDVEEKLKRALPGCNVNFT